MQHEKTSTGIFNPIPPVTKNTGDAFKTFAEEVPTDFAYNPKIGEYIKSVMKSRNEEIKIAEIAEITGISRSYLYQIIPVKDTPPKNIKNTPSRNMILAVALALRFTLAETQQLLQFAKKSELSPRSNFDAVIIFALEKRYNLVKTNILLDEKNYELLIFDK